MHADGGSLVQLTNEPGYDGQPSWSPDGRTLAFVSDRGRASRDLYRMAADGGLLDQLVGENGAVERAIAPNGPLDRITELTEVIGQLAPNLLAMQDTVHELAETVDLLNQTVAPLGGLADRLPKRLTRGSRNGSAPSGGPAGPAITDGSERNGYSRGGDESADS